ncbi:MAG: hypothetical protein KDG51_10410 [Calditrichaeota bacterium]|nr:hypothetical protein [Calditrichota bacterium]
MAEAPKKKANTNKIIGIFLIVIGAFNLISLPFTEGTGKVILYLLFVIVLLAVGVCMFFKPHISKC